MTVILIVPSPPGRGMQIMNAITISRQSDQVLELEWTSSASHDMIADSALGVLSGMDSNFATIKSQYLGDEVGRHPSRG